jgi:hypothetical protein
VRQRDRVRVCSERSGASLPVGNGRVDSPGNDAKVQLTGPGIVAGRQRGFGLNSSAQQSSFVHRRTVRCAHFVVFKKVCSNFVGPCEPTTWGPALDHLTDERVLTFRKLRYTIYIGTVCARIAREVSQACRRHRGRLLAGPRHWYALLPAFGAQKFLRPCVVNGRRVPLGSQAQVDVDWQFVVVHPRVDEPRKPGSRTVPEHGSVPSIKCAECAIQCHFVPREFKTAAYLPIP